MCILINKQDVIVIFCLNCFPYKRFQHTAVHSLSFGFETFFPVICPRSKCDSGRKGLKVFLKLKLWFRQITSMEECESSSFHYNSYFCSIPIKLIARKVDKADGTKFRHIGRIYREKKTTIL